ncbi:Fc.00g033870.m01.CDS01 [Cosmosporella sp. VM-42]
MPPAQLFGTYRQYKQDTDSVASWLASTAKACGFATNLLSTPAGTQTSKTGRLKGKQRRNARGGGKKDKPKSEGKKTANHIIAIKDFLPLAQWIAGRRDPAVSVPDIFSTTIDRVIGLRSEFSGKLNESGAQPDAKSDEKHGYFVGVLEAVREVLRPRMTSRTAALAVNAAIDASTDSAQELGSRFAALHVDEPSQGFLDAFRNAPHERPKPCDDDSVSYEAEPHTSLEDALFALTVLMDDLNRIRSRIEWIWSNHTDGIFDLAASAVATNTAISFARGLIEEVSPILDKQVGGAWRVLNKFYLLFCLSKGYEPEQAFLENSQDNFNYDLYDMANECYLVAFRFLNSFVDVLDPRELPLIKEGMFGKYDASSDRASKTGRQKHQEDQILLMEYFTELMTVIRVIHDYPVEDEFLHGMRVLEKTGTVPFSLVFAAQVFLDIHHTMRAMARQSFLAMVDETSIIKNSLELHLDFHKNLKIQNWPVSNDHQLRDLVRLMKWMGSDPVHRAKARVYTRVGMPVPSEMEVHRIMMSSPVLAGLYLFRIRTEMYDVGLAVANAWGSITYTAHLYNALLQERLVESQWSDMDIMLSNFGDSNIWTGGERPKTIADCFQKFCLQMGISASAFTKNRRRNTTVASRAGPRGIKDGAPVSSMFKTQICSGAGMDWTPELIDDIVARSAYQMEGSINDGNLTMTRIDNAQELRAKDQLRQRKSKARASGRDTTLNDLLPNEIAQSLVLTLNSESLEMAFPLLLMHRWCWKLLRSIKDSCDIVLRQLYTPAYMDKESELPWVVGYILMAANGFDGVPDLRLLNLAAVPLNTMIGCGAGRIAIEIAREIGKDIQFAEEDSEDETGGLEGAEV